MPFERLLLGVATVAVLCSACVTRTTTTSLPSVPSTPRLAEEVTLSTPWVTDTGKIAELRGDTVVFLPAPYWGAEPRMYPLDAISALGVRRAGRAGTGYLYGMVAGFTVLGALAAGSAQYDEDYSAGLIGAGLVGFAITGPLGALLWAGSRTTTYDLPEMSEEDRRELVRRLMASDGEDSGTGEGTW